MPKLTDTQLVILSAASQRDDRGVELPANLKGGAACKVVDKLIRAGKHPRTSDQLGNPREMTEPDSLGG
jgi:hypothetical protein